MGAFVDTATSLSPLMIGTTFDTATTSLASKCITYADNKIRDMLSKRYDVSSEEFQTFASAPPLLKDLGEQIAIGFMYKFMARGGKDGMKRAEDFLKPAVETLDKIADFEDNMRVISNNFIKRYKVGSVPFMPYNSFRS